MCCHISSRRGHHQPFKLINTASRRKQEPGGEGVVLTCGGRGVSWGRGSSLAAGVGRDEYGGQRGVTGQL